ncbi:APSES transcription factor Xbp1 [Apiospora hydei]|uniref:APSES transcription factor Xbp1 n=1 Tax=Apiospora hydei TaxID=1337664 RepID=A0ABR1WBQ2_9PEZI
MLSVASLLNPAPSGPSRHRLPPSPAASSPTNSFADETAFFERPIMPKQKVAKDAAVFTNGKPKGTVNFQPHERLDETSLREARKFQVFPLGKIQDYCRHIPYNSGKKDFFEKTGRESFEVFQYVFRLPGDDTEYVVMWDYNVGLVRMTPFFKCCKYSKVSQSPTLIVARGPVSDPAKTTPAKMLNMNPGLKEITHSITGGSIMAQGYWMPFNCAKAVCATFCYRIAGALIPIFGPGFPSMCIPPDAPEHGRMIIDPTTILHSTREADRFRRLYSNMVTSASGSGVSPSRDHRRPIRLGGYDDARPEYPRLRVRRPFFSSENPYGIDTDGEVSPATDRSLHGRFLYSPIQVLTPLRPPTSSWTPVNNPHLHHHHRYDTVPPPPPPPPPPHNHWLSAVPRLASPQPYHHVAHPPMHTPSPAIYHHHHHHSHVPHMPPSQPLLSNGNNCRNESRRVNDRQNTWSMATARFCLHAVLERREETRYYYHRGSSPWTGKEGRATPHEPERSGNHIQKQCQTRGVASASTSPTDVAFPRKRQRASSM